MNFGLIENTIIKIMDHSQDNRTFYLEIMGFNRKVAISWDLLQQIVLEEIKEEIKDDEENNKE